MYCENCKAEIEEGRDYCNKCGTNIVIKTANDSVKKFIPISTPVKARQSMTKADLIVGGIILISLMLQAYIYARANKDIVVITTLAFPIVYGVVAAIVYMINKTHNLKKIILRTLLSFLISTCIIFPYIVTRISPTWSLFEAIGILIYGLLATVIIVFVNMFLFYLVILVWFVGLTVTRKLE